MVKFFNPMKNPKLFQNLKNLERKFMSITPHAPATARKELGEDLRVGGVYAIWEKEKLRYFGETCNLDHRLDEILNKGRHHSLVLLKVKGATGRERAETFCGPKSKHSISWMIIPLGRKEFEEYMVLKHEKDLKNHQGGRFRDRSDISDWKAMVKAP
jgi:hypothetical protein